MSSSSFTVYRSSAKGDYNKFLELALNMAKVAGKMIRETFYTEKTISTKDEVSIDLVTETDKAVEKYIIETIKKEFPLHSILAEESFQGGSYNLTEKPTWIIDPIDGTTNFVHRHPFVCVSIALSINREIVVGVVFNPIMDELYQAVIGEGAFLNGKPIKCSETKTINQSVVSTNVGYDRTPEGIEFMLSNMKNILNNNVQSMRSAGSAAVEICAVAVGRVDVFFEFGIHPWDIAAGVLILSEAGGITIEPSGDELDLESRKVLAGNKDIVKEMVKILQLTTVPEKWKKFGRQKS